MEPIVLENDVNDSTLRFWNWMHEPSDDPDVKMHIQDLVELTHLWRIGK